MKPLPYTYKGRPITDYRRSGRPLRGRGGGGSGGWLKFILLVFALAGAFLAVYGIWLLAEKLLASDNKKDSPGTQSIPQAVNNALPPEETSYPEWRRISGMARELYEAGKFEEAADTLRPLFDAVPPTEKLYRDASNLLFNISTELDRDRSAGKVSYEEYRAVKGDSLSLIATEQHNGTE